MQLSEEFVLGARLGAEMIFWLLLLTNIASFAIIAERAWYFWRRRIDADQLVRHFLNYLRLHDLPRARGVLLRYPAPECTVLLAGVGELDHGLSIASAAMHSATAREQIRMESNLTALQVIAHSATLLGVLGTVLGVLGALKGAGTALVDAQGAMSPAFAGALASLSAIAAGLAVAIPAAAAAIMYQRRVRLIVERIEMLIQLTLSTAERQKAAAQASAEAAQAAAQTEAATSATATVTPGVISITAQHVTAQQAAGIDITKLAKAA